MFGRLVQPAQPESVDPAALAQEADGAAEQRAQSKESKASRRSETSKGEQETGTKAAEPAPAPAGVPWEVTRDKRRSITQETSRAAMGSGELDRTAAPAFEGADEEDDEAASDNGFEIGGDIDVHNFEGLVLDGNIVSQVQSAWAAFIQLQGSADKAGEAVYGALFDGAPQLQPLFTTPRAVQAMRFMAGLSSFVEALGTPQQLKILVETLAFGHLHLDVTVPRVVLFRDCIMELLQQELRDRFTDEARVGWLTLLNYVGGAIIYVKTHYADRLQTLATSWRKASQESVAGPGDAGAGGEQRLKGAAEKEEGDSPGASGDSHSGERSGEVKPVAVSAPGDETPLVANSEVPSFWEGRRCPQRCPKLPWRSRGAAADSSQSARAGVQGAPASDGQQRDGGDGPSGASATSNSYAQSIVRTFKAMFEFNAAVMGFGSSIWLREVSASFDAIVTNISNSTRLQEECDVLVLKINRVQSGEINLGEFKSCMLATLRSLLPKDWDSAHEVAWNWLWDNVERLLRRNLGKPNVWHQHLHTFYTSIDEKQGFEMRKTIYRRFFQDEPAGQEFFKQSDTRLHFIAEKIMHMTIEILEDPYKMVDDISALGLRHVGYGIPTELFRPFVSVMVGVVQDMTEDKEAVEAFRWTLGLIAKMLTRTILEGSTIVMKAINSNSLRMLRKALTMAPRGKRATWLLQIEVGTQSISPFMWSIDGGLVEVASAMISDLLAMRADRERYYYGVDELFGRHPDIIDRLCRDAPQLLPVLLEGLIWRSRTTQNGQRRVNYYVKHLMVTGDGQVSPTLSWLVQAKDPKVMADDVLIMVSDTMWNGLVSRQFIFSKISFMLSLCMFMLSQAILPKHSQSQLYSMRVLVFGARMVNYIVTMCRPLAMHLKLWAESYKDGKTMRLFCIPVPQYLKEPIYLGGFFLTLFMICMAVTEPIFWCLVGEEGDDFPTEICESSDGVRFLYSVFCMAATTVHWLLLIDLAVFSTGLSAFVLVIGQVLSEMTRFLAALVFLLLTFGSAISVLEHTYFEMRDIPNAVIALLAVTLRLFEDDYRNMYDEPALLAAVFLFVTAAAVVLLNLLIAQINCSYVYIYQDMLGFARLNRAAVIVETLEQCSEVKWRRFVQSLGLDKPLEFNEGDVGLSGGIQVLEPAGAHTVLQDRILRYGGSCALDMPWPEEQAGPADEEDKADKIERMLRKVLGKMGKVKRRAQGSASTNEGTSGGVEEASSGEEEDAAAAA